MAALCFHEPAPIRHRERSAAIHRRKSAVMDCLAVLSLNRPRFVIANEVWRSIVEKAQSWIAALRSQ
jgi:hypothetical protein